MNGNRRGSDSIAASTLGARAAGAASAPSTSNLSSSFRRVTKKPILRRAVSDTAATQQSQQQRKKPGVVAMAKMGYQECVNAIIRPPRAHSYKEETLGPQVFNYCGRTFARSDLYITNERDMKMKCSHWIDVDTPADKVPCVIYMHGNSSARLEVIPQLSYLLSLGVSVFSFDFAGSGKSDGDYVSLGFYERDDLQCVVEHLRSTGTVSTIALWGRSMGAATALMHAHRDPSISCMIVDSSFADLTQLAEEMVERGKDHGVSVPTFVVTMALRMIRGSVKKQAGFDIRECCPISHADKCFVPALFVHGKNDVFINSHHSRDIHERYAGDKNLIIVDGDHNSPRPRFMFDSASIFLQTCLQIPPDWTLARDPRMNRMTPPWFYPGAMDGLGLAFSRSLSSSSYGAGSPQKLSPVHSKSDGDVTAAPAVVTTTRASAKTDTTEMEQIRNDEEAAYALAAELNEESGMTIERQDDIQAALLKMLGTSEDKISAQRTTYETRSPSPSSALSDVERTSSVLSSDDLVARGLVGCQSVEKSRKSDP